MNIEAELPQIGQIVLRDHEAVRQELNYLCDQWEKHLLQHQGPMLFGDFSIADAYFSPVVMRMITYQLPVSEIISAYIERVQALESVHQWVDEACEEQDFIASHESYRTMR